MWYNVNRKKAERKNVQPLQMIIKWITDPLLLNFGSVILLRHRRARYQNDSHYQQRNHYFYCYLFHKQQLLCETKTYVDMFSKKKPLTVLTFYLCLCGKPHFKYNIKNKKSLFPHYYTTLTISSHILSNRGEYDKMITRKIRKARFLRCKHRRLCPIP